MGNPNSGKFIFCHSHSISRLSARCRLEYDYIIQKMSILYSIPMKSRFRMWFFHFQKSFHERFPWALGGILGISILSWFFTTKTPEQGSIIIAVGIIGIASTVCCFLQFLFDNVRRSILVSVGGAIFLTLRTLRLTDPLYVILLILFLISIELSTRNR
jgi:hypothetical protein